MSQHDLNQPRMGQKDFDQSLISTFRANDGKVGGFFAPISLLLLTTTGAKGGQPHTTPLAYTTDNDRIVIVASNSGSPHNPAWYYNIQAHPSTTVEIGHERFQARAVIAQGSEREYLLSKMVEQVPGIGEYQRMTPRQIPVVVLERVR